VFTRADRVPSDIDDDLLAVSPFEVADPRYDLWREGLMSVLSANLDGAGPLRTVPTALVLRRWQGRFDAEAAGRLGRATGAGLAVTGRVDGAGVDSVRIVAILVDAAPPNSGPDRSARRGGSGSTASRILLRSLLRELAGRGLSAPCGRPPSVPAHCPP
jgi:hypothetical protein